MRSIRRRATMIVSIVALSSVVAGGEVAATRSSDEAALQPARHGGGTRGERRNDRPLSRMTPHEKLQQLPLLSHGQKNHDAAPHGGGARFRPLGPGKKKHLH